MALPKLDFEAFRSRLMQERETASKALLDLSNENDQAEAADARELTPADDHTADSATNIFVRERDMTEGNNLQLILQQIELALGKIDGGTYGICDQCGKPIGAGRLEALPYATLCLADQARMEGPV